LVQGATENGLAIYVYRKKMFKMVIVHHYITLWETG